MKADDKERVLPDDPEDLKVPKIEVYTNKINKAAKKPWFTGCLGIVLASFAVILSLAVFVAFLGYMGMLPEKIQQSGIFGIMEEHEKRIGDLELERFCLLPKDAGNCLDYMNRWYFDTKTGKCLKFVYSGCLGNANNFETEDDCQKKCFSWGDDYRIPPEIEPRDTSFCSQEPDSGPCKASKPRFYFDDSDKSCKPFVYGGCKGNRNNFLTEKDCMDLCNQVSDRSGNQGDVCQLKPETGTCRGSFEKWYFNSKSGQCEIFEYGGCDGNRNNFDSKELCENQCNQQESRSRSDDNDICSLPSEIGPCRAAVPRFYFDGEARKCEMFMFGGCSGNGNNFETEDDCQNRCQA